MQIDEHLSRINDLGLCLNNRDDLGAAHEARNLACGRPAYWYRGQTSPASWVVSLSQCKEHNYSFLKALEVFVERNPRVDVLEILDAVIPLNDAAVTELELCYRLQSSFRENLASREREAIYNPVYFPNMDGAIRASWARRYAEAQARFEQRQIAARDLKPVTSPIASLVIAAANAVEVA